MKPSDIYTVSITYDWRLYRQDIAGSMAHVKMLGKQSIISKDDVDAICVGLSKIENEIEKLIRQKTKKGYAKADQTKEDKD